MKPEKARVSDVPQIHKLVNSFADNGEMLTRPLSEIYENIRDYFVVRKGERVIACAALQVSWADLAEIKSLAVAEDCQKRSIGGQIVGVCLKEAKELGISIVFCLTYKPVFFEKRGFSRVDKSELPQKVWGECYRCSKYPDCDEVALIHRLEAGT